MNLGRSYLITTGTLSKVSLMQCEHVLFKVINVLRKHLTSQLALRKQNRGVDSFLNPGGLAVVQGAKSAPHGLNRVD